MLCTVLGSEQFCGDVRCDRPERQSASDEQIGAQPVGILQRNSTRCLIFCYYVEIDPLGIEVPPDRSM